MASGSFSNGSGQNCKLVINWSSSKGNNGSTVNATLIAQNQNNWYFSAYVYGGYGITINGNQKTGSGAQLSGSVNGSAGLISHSVWVAYTGDKTITISGYANFNGIVNLSNQTISGNVKLDNVGTAPSMGSVTAPSTGVISETSNSITVSWNGGSSYNGSGNYRVEVSINGGGWTSIATGLDWSTRSYTYHLPNTTQGTSYQFRVDCSNNIGWSSYEYSGTVTLNKINPPTIGDIGTYNPYTNSTLDISLTGGSSTNGENLVRLCDLYYGDTWLCGSKGYDATSWNNTSQTIIYAATSYASALGSKAYSSNNFRIVAWCENAHRSRSSYVSKNFTVNINSDGGATPTIGAPTISGGELGYPSTCFVAGISTINVVSPNATLRRAPSGTTLSYQISCSGTNSQNTQNANFYNLSQGHKTIIVTATDSRGLSVSVSKTIVVQPYAAPTIRNYLVTRLDNPQTSAKLIYELGYSNIYSYADGTNKGDQLNTINTQQYSKDNSTWVNASNGLVITDLSTESIYTIYLRVADKLRPTTYTFDTQKVPTIKTNVAIRKHGIGINCVPQTSYALEVNGSSKISGSLDASNMLQVNSNGVAIGKASEKSAFEVNMDSYFYGDIYGQKITFGDNTTYGGRFNVFNGSNLWVKLGTWDSCYDSSVCKITVLTGNGYNAATYQNTEIEIFIKDSWQSSLSSTNAFGMTFIVKYNYNYSISSCVMAKSDHVCDVWVRLPYDYGNGTYLFEGNGHWTHSIETRPFDSNPTSGVLQPSKEMTADFKGYPVGSIYLSWDNTNPQTFMGGTWVQFGQGRTLMGQGTGNDGSTSMSFTAESSGGEYKHKLTVTEMPSHGHKLYARGGQTAQISSPFADNKPITQGSNSYGFNVSSTGGDQSHNNIQPYIVIYFWRRTA